MNKMKKDEQDINVLMEEVIGCCFTVHSKLGPGFLESVYKKALLIELSKNGLTVESEAPLSVLYDGESVGTFYADIVVEGKLILELKAVEDLALIHEIQLVNYLKATGIHDGLLINFGSYKVQIKRKFKDRSC